MVHIVALQKVQLILMDALNMYTVSPACPRHVYMLPINQFGDFGKFGSICAKIPSTRHECIGQGGGNGMHITDSIPGRYMISQSTCVYSVSVPMTPNSLGNNGKMKTYNSCYVPEAQ